MSTPLIDQLHAYFDDVDRQQGPVDLEAVRHGVEERVIPIELSPDNAVPPDGPTSGRRGTILAAAAAMMLVVGVFAVLVGREAIEIQQVTAPPVPSSTSLVVRPFDPRIRCALERCPSVAASPDGDVVTYDQASHTVIWYDSLVVSPVGELVAYDEAANTLTHDVGPHIRPVIAHIDADQVRLVAVGPSHVVYLLVGSPGMDAWELVGIDLTSQDIRRAPASSPNIERSDRGLVERLCWSGCQQDTRRVMHWLNREGSPDTTYPKLSRTTSDVVVELGEQRWEIAWPHTLSTDSQAAPRWGGGAVLSIVPESGDAPSELIELLPDGSVQRFGLGSETVHTLLPDGSAVIWRDGQLVRLIPPQPAEPPLPWSPELMARPMDPSIDGQLAVSPGGTLVGYDPAAAILTWYEDEPRVVTITARLTGTEEEGDPSLAAIGPDDVAYFQSWRSSSSQGDELVAVAPSGTEITRRDWTSGATPFVNATASGLAATRCAWIANRCSGGSVWPPPNSPLAMPWVDVAGNPLIDTRPYPTANDTEAGVEVRLAEQEWLLEHEQLSGHHIPDIVLRSDGGLVMLLDETFDAPGKPLKLLELLPDGTVERYVVPFTGTALPDGSVIVEHNSQLIRLTPPT